MPQGYHEAPEPRTGKALKHQASARKKKAKNISNVEILPSKQNNTGNKIHSKDEIVLFNLRSNSALWR